jgi:hypothetical protein
MLMYLSTLRFLGFRSCHLSHLSGLADVGSTLNRKKKIKDEEPLQVFDFLY